MKGGASAKQECLFQSVRVCCHAGQCLNSEVGRGTVNFRGGRGEGREGERGEERKERSRAVPPVTRCSRGWLEVTSCAAIFKSGSSIPLQHLYTHLHP